MPGISHVVGDNILTKVEWEDPSTHVVSGIANGQVLIASGAGITGVDPTSITRYADIEFTFGDGVNAIVAANEPEQWIEIPFNCTITSARLTADAAGNFQVDIWRATYAFFPPVDANSIAAAAPPTLSSQVKSESTLSGWSVNVVRGDWLKVHVDSAGTVKRVVLSLGVTTT